MKDNSLVKLGVGFHMSFIRKYWIDACSIIAIGLFGVVLYRSYIGYYDCPSEGVAETFGKSIVYALLCFFALASLRKRFGKRTFFMLCFSISFSLCAVYDSIKVSRQISQLNNAKQEMVQISKEFSDSTTQRSTKNYSSQEYGDIAVVLSLMREGYEFSEKLWSEINANAAELNDILLPAKLCEYDQIINARSKVKRFTTKLNGYENQLKEEYERMESMLKTAKLESENNREHVLKGFEEGKTKAAKLLVEYCRIERVGAEKMEDILRFLLNHHGSYKQKDGVLVFEQKHDTAAYNQLFRDLMEIIKEEEVIVQRLEESRQVAISDIQNACQT